MICGDEHTHLHAHHKGHVMLGMLELGIIVHSVVIGVAFGASHYRTSTAVGYVVALSFHQLFEGMGLGTCIAGCMRKVEGEREEGEGGVHCPPLACTHARSLARTNARHTLSFRPGLVSILN